MYSYKKSQRVVPPNLFGGGRVREYSPVTARQSFIGQPKQSFIGRPKPTEEDVDYEEVENE